MKKEYLNYWRGDRAIIIMIVILLFFILVFACACSSSKSDLSGKIHNVSYSVVDTNCSPANYKGWPWEEIIPGSRLGSMKIGDSTISKKDYSYKYVVVVMAIIIPGEYLQFSWGDVCLQDYISGFRRTIIFTNDLQRVKDYLKQSSLES